MKMTDRNKMISKAAAMLDAVIEEHSAPLKQQLPFLDQEQYHELYRKQYFQIEEEALAQLNIIIVEDTDDMLSLTKDIDPLLQHKLQAFAFRFNPSRDNLN